jgi:hypothetical protein
MFPFSFASTIEVPVAGNAVASVSKTILSTLEGYIRAQKPNISISSSEHQITFSDSVPHVRFFRKSNLLDGIDRGVIEVVPDDHRLLISYKLWFTGLFVSASLLTITVALCIFSSFSLQNFAIALAIWLCYFGGSFIVIVIRFDSLVRSALIS